MVSWKKSVVQTRLANPNLKARVWFGPLSNVGKLSLVPIFRDLIRV
jgi:hypothetical protein